MVEAESCRLELAVARLEKWGRTLLTGHLPDCSTNQQHLSNPCTAVLQLLTPVFLQIFLPAMFLLLPSSSSDPTLDLMQERCYGVCDQMVTA